ncbi:MAG: nucleotidyl transferase AbiEii/AbiGii toxin family protein [Acidobacteria bacterium]|nr:nucleotidyl transferase AbiEii/AbiGii toxin family protein [Acidobacteriota bacterium]
MIEFHEEILTGTQQGMIAQLGAVASKFGYYLAGGTAIALHVGHRRSEDFDWFVPTPGPVSQAVVEAIGTGGLALEIDDVASGTLLGRIQGVKASFFDYPYPLLDETLDWPAANARIASVRDLAAMKLLAIAQRGSRKDFVDIYELLRRGGDLKVMLADFQAKFRMTETISVKRGLVYFDDAERERMPEMLVALSWPDLRNRLLAELQALTRL